MPSLADLHRHIDGSIRPATLQTWAEDDGASLDTLPQFSPGMGLDAALACFQTILRHMQSTTRISQACAEICEDATREGVTSLELRFAPQLHHEIEIPDAIDAAIEGIAGRAGLTLCVLYGDAPELAEQLVKYAIDRKAVVGLDLAGGPSASHPHTLKDYRDAFGLAKRHNLGCTAHVGEGRPPQEILDAITTLNLDRIGHGTTLLESPEVIDLICEQEITVEACITSNWHTGAISSTSAHPIRAWLDHGIPTVVCTDNTLLSQTDATHEYKLAAELIADSTRFSTMIEHGHRAIFKR